jgi:lysophospholipase L1-like esterase
MLCQKAKLAGIVMLGSMLALAVALWDEIPQWRLAGTRSIPAASVAFGMQILPCSATQDTMAIFGDSHVSGIVADGAPQASFGRFLAEARGAPGAVSQHGIGGHTAQMGEATWGSEAIAADVVLLMYGTNDAAPRGWLRPKQPVPLPAFTASLTRQIMLWRARNAAVVLVAPPPGGSRAIQARLAPYRKAVRQLGQSLGVPVIDPADAFAAEPAAQPVLTYDALHMNAAGHRALGRWIAAQMCGPS